MRAKALALVRPTCCIGIGRSKTEAKIANHLAKKNKFFNGSVIWPIWTHALQKRLLAQVDVSEVWGVGRQNCKKLNTMGVQSVLDLINANPKEIKKQFSIVMEKTVLELQGLSCIDLSDDAVAKKQIISSRSYGNPVYEMDD